MDAENQIRQGIQAGSFFNPEPATARIGTTPIGSGIRFPPARKGFEAGMVLTFERMKNAATGCY